MMPKSPNGRTNVGTVSLDGNELKFDADDSLNIHMSHEPPADADTHELACRCPANQFALIIRAYMPT